MHIDKKKFEKIIDDQISLFLSVLNKECSEDSRKMKYTRIDFPIFNTFDEEGLNYKYFMEILERYLREYMISELFCLWFKEQKINCYVYNDKRNVVKLGGCTNERDEKTKPIQFIVEYEGKRIGYRFTYPEINFFQEIKLLWKYKVHEIVVINFKKNFLDKEILGNVREESLKKFVEKYFSSEIYSMYIEKVRKAVDLAKKNSGFQTIQHLSLRKLSDFKINILNNIFNFEFRTKKYRKFDDNGNVTNVLYDLLSNDDYDIIYNNCFKKGLYEELGGQEKFARCFITSEYLYDIFKNKEDNYFDYTTIISGYFKAVELLLEKIVFSTFNKENHNDLWIYYNNNGKHNGEDEDYRKKLVRFSEKFKNEFSTEMGSLINFIVHNNDGWYISNQKSNKAKEKSGKEKVIECLHNYRNIRNKNIHKEIIDNLDTIEVIRDNTILCLLYLLGGCKIYGNGMNASKEIESNSFNRFSKELIKIPRGVQNFYLQYDEKEIMAIRAFDQERIVYDERGNITTPVLFIQVSDFSIGEYDEFISKVQEKDKIIVTSDNMPTKVYWYNKEKGKVEIRFRND